MEHVFVSQPAARERSPHLDVACVAGALTFTKLEVTSAENLTTWVRAKADHMRQAFVDGLIKEIEQRGWGVLEYRENTTGI